MTDERVAEQVGAGSEAAFTVLFNRHHQQLYRYCRSLTGNEQDAQDALQATFANALVALRARRRNAPLRPWLYRIAHNESISIIRTRRPSTEVPEELAGSVTLDDELADRERLATLVADLRELPERQRGALVMRELAGLSHEEIAQALEVSTGAAKQTILEARRSLQEFEEGRAMSCDAVLRIISDADGRALRSRRVRAHLRDCSSCDAFMRAIPRRRSEMLALWPALPAASATSLLAKLTGAGSGHGGGGGGAGIAAGGAAKGIAAGVSVKAAVVAGAAAVATATVGTVAVLHHSRSGSPTPPIVRAGGGHSRPAASASTASGSGTLSLNAHGSASSRTTHPEVPTRRRAADHRATSGADRRGTQAVVGTQGTRRHARAPDHAAKSSVGPVATQPGRKLTKADAHQPVRARHVPVRPAVINANAHAGAAGPSKTHGASDATMHPKPTVTTIARPSATHSSRSAVSHRSRRRVSTSTKPATAKRRTTTAKRKTATSKRKTAATVKTHAGTATAGVTTPSSATTTATAPATGASNAGGGGGAGAGAGQSHGSTTAPGQLGSASGKSSAGSS